MVLAVATMLQLLVVVVVEAEEPQVVPRLGLKEWEAQVGLMAEAADQEAIVLPSVIFVVRELVEPELEAQSE